MSGRYPYVDISRTRPRPLLPAQRHQLSPMQVRVLEFSAAMGQVSPSGAGNLIQFRIRNPRGSGRIIDITKVIALCTASLRIEGVKWGIGKSDLGTAITVFSRSDPPMVPLGVASRTNVNAIGDPNPSVIFDRKTEANTPFTWDQKVRLRPDSAFEVVYGGGAVTDVFTVDADWTERPDREIWR